MGFEDDPKACRAGIEAEVAGLRTRVAQLKDALPSFSDVIRFHDPSAAVAVPAVLLARCARPGGQSRQENARRASGDNRV
ncbi:hypothetical protein [Aureimonas endophytica]|uniref:hypothetical protein n=1 Tax=Aureimonas endophytica TaxID=2027858 RepID=UPI00166D03D5|nr:hypothetical protein [Aureimonas endophytica]